VAAQAGQALGISAGAAVQVLFQPILLLGARWPELRIILCPCSTQQGNVLLGPSLAAR